MLYYLLCVAGNFLPASRIHSTSLLFRLRWRINRIYLAGVARCTFPDSGNPVLEFLYISRCGQAWDIGRLQYFRSIRVPVRPDRLHVPSAYNYRYVSIDLSPHFLHAFSGIPQNVGLCLFFEEYRQCLRACP